MENINQLVIHENYRDISPDSAIVVDINNAEIHQVVCKIIFETGYVICIDFNSGNKVVGIITKSDLQKSLLHKGGSVREIMNTNFSYTTMKNLENDIDKLKDVSFLPVLDEEGQLLFILNKSTCINWLNAQNFELEWWKTYYSEHFSYGSVMDNTRSLDVSLLPLYYINLLKSILVDSEKALNCIEVGAGPALGYMTSISKKHRRIIIEPLCEKYKQIREENNYIVNNEEGIEYYAVGADIFIPELEDTADVLFGMNMLDHTPEWPFVLGNIASYVKRNGYLYLATDIDHHQEKVSGHFDITYNPEKLLRLIEQLGFEIIWKKFWARPDPKACTIVSCFAKKII